MAIQAAALAPFAGAPQLLLAYQVTPAMPGAAPAGPAVRQELRLPVAPHKFLVPEPGISKELFFEQWKAHRWAAHPCLLSAWGMGDGEPPRRRRHPRPCVVVVAVAAARSQPPSKSQEMVDRGALGLPALASPSVVSVLRLANLGVEHGYLDPSPSNEAGAGYFACGPPGGPEQTVLVMVRGGRSALGGAPPRLLLVVVAAARDDPN